MTPPRRKPTCAASSNCCSKKPKRFASFTTLPSDAKQTTACEFISEISDCHSTLAAADQRPILIVKEKSHKRRSKRCKLDMVVFQ